MKRVYVYLMILTAVGFSSAYGRFRFDALTWFSYGAYMSEGDTVIEDGVFIERGYFTFRGDLNEKATVRLTLDVVNAPDLFKYAYFDYKFIDAFAVRLGMTGVNFGHLPLWKYPIPAKSLVDTAKAASSADLGIDFYGKLSFMSYNLQFFNGGGYKKWASDDTVGLTFAGVASSIFHFLKSDNLNLDLGLSYKYTYVDTPPTHAFDGFIEFKLYGFGLVVEYLGIYDTAKDADSALAHYINGDI
jgi:hypothetical protein